MATDDTRNRIYSQDEAAPLLHPDLKSRTMERWRRKGTGPEFVRIGRRVGYTREALDDYKARQTRRDTSNTP